MEYDEILGGIESSTMQAERMSKVDSVRTNERILLNLFLKGHREGIVIAGPQAEKALLRDSDLSEGYALDSA